MKELKEKIKIDAQALLKSEMIQLKGGIEDSDLLQESGGCRTCDGGVCKKKQS